jgi:peptide/nickel transport system permease protein
MTRYIIRRLIQSVIVLWLLSIGFFALIHAYPPGARVLLEEAREGTLHQPLPAQYLAWLGHVLQGNFGESLVYSRPVTAEISERVPATLELMLAALLFALVVSLAFGITSAVRQYSVTDYAITVLAYGSLAMPTFWVALIVQEIFAVKLHILPDYGLTSVNASHLSQQQALGDYISHLIMPAFVLALQFIAGWSRYLRSSLLDVIKQDYVRTARAKGVDERDVIRHHAIRNALIPFITVVAVSFGGIMGGAVVTETVFAWPGMGLLFSQSVTQGDYPTLMACLILSAFAVITCNFAADLLYVVVDPRIRYE